MEAGDKVSPSTVAPIKKKKKTKKKMMMMMKKIENP